MKSWQKLPPGQHEIDTFPRFGLTQFASRCPSDLPPVTVAVSGEVGSELRLYAQDLATLPRIVQKSDFHCVTTWTKRDLLWSGFRFRDFYQSIVLPQAQPTEGVDTVILRCRDGFRSCLPLEDMLADTVLLADQLDGKPLTVKHGAPMRLITPAHYGYKSAKHIDRMEFWAGDSHFKAPALKFMNHPRARVEFEERGLYFPGWLLRTLYRPMIKRTVRLFDKTMK